MTVGPTDEYSDDEYPGIDCAGNATINLVGKNIVEVNKRGDAGIFVREGSTLTIGGTGSLEAYGGSQNNTSKGAGIGGYHIHGEKNGVNCGHIVINSGTITAVGNTGCAGIGSGRRASCDGITINGGTVTASNDGEAADIGSGQNGSCGNITISGGTVEATGGNNAAGIGSGYWGKFTSITITNGITSVKATRVVGDEEGYKPLPIGFGKNDRDNGSVTFGNRDMIFWGDLESIVNDDEYGGIHIEVSNDGDVWTLTPAP